MSLIDIKSWLGNRYVQLVGALVAGALLSALFYPSSQTEERIKQKYEQITKQKVQEQRDITTSVVKEYNSLSQTYRNLQDEYKSKVSQLTSTIQEMTSSRIEIFYKLTKPDGTIEERRYFEYRNTATAKMLTDLKTDYERKMQETQSETQKKHEAEVAQMKDSYSRQIASLTKKISILEKETTTTINPKKFGLEAGATLERRGYAHATYTFWGPMFLGTHYETDGTKSSFGMGLGINL